MKKDIIAPESKTSRCLILNSISKQVVRDDNKFVVLDCQNLIGETETFVVSSDFDLSDIKDRIGKLIDVTYKDCIAGLTQWIDDSDLLPIVRTHEISHKQFVCANPTTKMGLLIHLKQLDMMDLYEELKELND